MPDVGRVPRLPRGLKARLADQQLSPSVVEWMAFGQDLAACCKQTGDHLFPYTYQVADFPEGQSILLNEYYDCMRWGVPYRDLECEDPLVSTFAYVPKRGTWVHRKSYRRLPVTELALHCALMHTPWLHGWRNYAWRSSGIEDASGFIDAIRAVRGATVSDSFGCVTFVEGTGWLAYVVNGYTHFGPDRFIRLYTSELARLKEIPKPVREMFQLTKQSQLQPSR